MAFCGCCRKKRRGTLLKSHHAKGRERMRMHKCATAQKEIAQRLQLPLWHTRWPITNEKTVRCVELCKSDSHRKRSLFRAPFVRWVATLCQCSWWLPGALIFWFLINTKETGRLLASPTVALSGEDATPSTCCKARNLRYRIFIYGSYFWCYRHERYTCCFEGELIQPGLPATRSDACQADLRIFRQAQTQTFMKNKRLRTWTAYSDKTKKKSGKQILSSQPSFPTRLRTNTHPRILGTPTKTRVNELYLAPWLRRWDFALACTAMQWHSQKPRIMLPHLKLNFCFLRASTHVTSWSTCIEHTCIHACARSTRPASIDDVENRKKFIFFAKTKSSKSKLRAALQTKGQRHVSKR